MTQSDSRTTRLEVRISPKALALVRRAAEMQGRSLSDFVVSAAQEAARKAIEDDLIMRLSIKDQRALVDSFLSHPKPNAALRRAAAAHRRLFMQS